MAELEKVIKVYECCKNPWNRRCEECPVEKDCCHDGLPTFAIKDALELLKEFIDERHYYEEWEEGYGKNQQQIIRCKDCKHYDGDGTCIKIGIAMLTDDWFCADGERKDDE